MSVTEKLNGQGQFSVTLKEEAPESLVRLVGFAGHLVVTTERMEVTALSDADFRDQARYMGVVVYKPMNQNGLSIKGKGLVWWLGDGANRGKVFRGGTTLDFVNKGFDDGWTDILAALTPITKGSIESTGGTYTHKFDLVTQRQAADRFADAFGAEYRINRDFTLDSGASGFLYNATPTAVIARRFSGDDPETDGLVATQIESTEDIESFVTTAILAAEGTGDSLQTSEQSLGDKLFKDPQGNDIDRSQVFNQPDTTTGDASDRAQLLLDQFGVVQKTVKLNLEDFHVKGEFEVGDLIYVWDPKTSLFDNTKELAFRGQVLNPIAIRVVGMSWPVIRGMGVYYRDEDGVYTDLTDYVAWQAGAVTIEVGASSRNLVEGNSEALDARITIDPDGGDLLTPSQPTHKSTPWSTFQDVNSQGIATSRVVVEWNTPTNTDSSVVTDGLGFNIRYRKQGETEYSTQFAAWGLEASVVDGLTPGVVYELNVEAGDVNGNYSGYGAVSDEVVTAATDGAAPSQPSAPTVAGNVLNIQITHDLQRQAGGDLESDMDHLKVYADTSSGFTPSASNLLGEIPLTQSHISVGVVVIATFRMESTTERFVVVTAVDRDGNESVKSNESTVTALLIANQHVTNLNVDKLVGGTISTTEITIASTLTMGTGGVIRTATSGNRIEIIEAFGDQIRFFSGGSSETTPAQMVVSAVSNAPELQISNGTTASLGIGAFLRFNRLGDAALSASQSLSTTTLELRAGGSQVLLVKKTQVLHPDGNASKPGIAFIVNDDLGWHRSGSNKMAVSVIGVDRGDWTSAGLFINVAGSATTPSLRFNDINTGIYQPGSDEMAFATGGVRRWQMDGDGDLWTGANSATVSNLTPRILLDFTGFLWGTRSGGAALVLQRTSSDGSLATFARQTAVVGSISVNGTTTAYNTSSDKRLKDNIRPYVGGLDVVR